jgi:hypothetical protein
MTAAYQQIMPRGLLYQVRRIGMGDDEVLTPPEDEIGGGMEVEGADGGGLSSPPPGDEEAGGCGMDVE